MRAFQVTGPRQAEVVEIDVPVVGERELLIEVHRAGICGTDVEFFTGEMEYLRTGVTSLPLQLGHEWVGRVLTQGPEVTGDWVGRRVTGDTMLGCGACAVCARGRQHVCPNRRELGITDGAPGALAERIVIPERAAIALPEELSDAAAALIEPGGNALRSVWATEARPGEHLLVLGSGTIGLLAALFADAEGIDVTVAGTRPRSLELARSLGIPHTLTIDEVAEQVRDGSLDHFDAVVEATSMETSPALAVEVVTPGGAVAFVGLSEGPSLIDSRQLAFKDVRGIGILSASPGIRAAAALFADGVVRPDALVAEVVGLDDVAERLSGRRGADAGPGPKIQVDPRR